MRRLRWQCRRGLLELDLLLASFLEQGYGNLSAAEKVAFKHLLEQSDQSLQDWIQDRQQPPEELMLIVDRVFQQYDYKGK